MSTLSDTGLPIEAVIPAVTAALDAQGVGVLTAEPGAGKTTVVPLRLLDRPWLGRDRILVLEPRRVAARAVARRMAAMLGESVGESVGWRTRDDRRVSERTRIEVITEGILTRRLQSDPTLPGVAAVLFDEFHERSIHADLGLALALETRAELRDDLRILVMSATIDAPAVAALLGDGSPAPIVDCPGRTHPITIHHQPRGKRDRLEPAVVAAVRDALRHDGDVLVFLPGVGEIRRCREALSGAVDAEPVELHGSLRGEEQDAALRSIPGRRRVVLSTDLAETSLTVDGIGTVVDSGLRRRPRFDPATGLSTLVTVEHSRASADQRAGRAGRLGPGVAYRLWSKMEHGARRAHDQAEIHEIDLATVVLESLAWGVGDPGELRLLDPPKRAALDEAFDVLTMLDAVDGDRRITPLGRQILSLPVHPRLGAMLSAVGDGPLGWPASILAALLTERDVLRGRPSERPVDLWPRVQLIDDEGARHPDADGGAIREVRRRANELAKRIGAQRSPVGPDDLGRSLALAYPDRIALKRAGQGGRFRLRSGGGAEIPKSDPLAHAEMLVAAEVVGDRRSATIRRAAPIDRLDIEFGFGDSIMERTFFGWDDARDDLVSRVERTLGALDLGTHEQPVRPSPEVVEALTDRIASTKLAVLPWNDRTRNLQARVAIAIEHGLVNDIDPIDDATLRAAAHDVFAGWLSDATRRGDIEKLDLFAILMARLGWAATRDLDDHVPEQISLASGRTRHIDYTAETPRFSARAQDLYGMSASPTVARGAVTLTVEVLSPADRPIQITADLAAFWSGSWVDVRKEMAGRYPKHDWPVDPC